jgi:hypothetical protein
MSDFSECISQHVLSSLKKIYNVLDMKKALSISARIQKCPTFPTRKIILIDQPNSENQLPIYVPCSKTWKVVYIWIEHEKNQLIKILHHGPEQGSPRLTLFLSKPWKNVSNLI